MIIWLLNHIAARTRNRHGREAVMAKADARMEHVAQIVKQQKQDSAIARRVAERLSVQERIAGDYRRELRRSE